VRRRGLLPSLALAALWLAPVPGATLGGEVRRGLAARSPALGRDIPYSLYLPDGYAGSARRYPVLYLLHGHGGTEADWANGGALGATLDALTAAGAVPPMLVVAPGMGNGWYVDNPDPGGLGAVEAAFLADLIPHVDRAWRTDARRAARAVAGLSMGGWGAVRLAMLRPDMFAAAASLSGALVPETWAATPEWAAWFSGAFGDPVDLARFRAASPFTLIPSFAAATPRPALFLTCGDDDDLGLDEATLLFYLALRRAGVPAELRITDGGHDWQLWSRELGPVLRFVGAAFAGAP
jgi:S-formylglutathione hydrolase FrmB